MKLNWKKRKGKEIEKECHKRINRIFMFGPKSNKEVLWPQYCISRETNNNKPCASRLRKNDVSK